MNSAELCQHSIDELNHGGFVSNIYLASFDRKCLWTGRVFQREEFLFFAVRDNHLGVLFKKCKAYGFAQATSAASDYNHASRKADIHGASTSKVCVRNAIDLTAPSE
jgi:hypothetical protein